MSSIYDVGPSGRVDPRALPILLKHLQLPHPPEVRFAIGHVMASGDCRFAWPTLLALFKAETDRSANGVKWAIGCALAKAAHKEVIPDVIELFEDLQHGENRIILCGPLMRSKNPRAREALEAARQDPDLAREVNRLLDCSLRRRAAALAKW